MHNLPSFPAFPKVRPELPPEFQDIYKCVYKENRQGGTKATKLSSRLEAWMHHKVAGVFRAEALAAKTLEIGAGTLNHIEFEPYQTHYDVVEPMEHLYVDSPHKPKVTHFYADITEIKSSERYERIVSIATFEHICNLPQVIAQAVLLLDDEGELRAAYPSEGGLMWHLGWRLTTGLEFYLKYKKDYSILMRHEHVNNWKEIREVLESFFGEVQHQVFGISPHFSFYQFSACRKPLKRVAEMYLQENS